MSYLISRQPALGFAVAAAGPIAAASGPLAPLVLGFTALATALPSFNIGAGRKEADQITPEQNKLGQALAQLDQILATQTLTAGDLRQLDTQLRGMWDMFTKFVYQPDFTQDGDTRASDGAIATMQPQVENRLQRIAAMLSAVLGRPVVPTMIQSAGVPSLEFRTSSDLVLPQAGFARPGAVPANYDNVIAPAEAGFDTGFLLKLALAAGVVYAVSRS